MYKMYDKIYVNINNTIVEAEFDGKRGNVYFASINRQSYKFDSHEIAKTKEALIKKHFKTFNENLI